jgi:hypothetical protein
MAITTATAPEASGSRAPVRFRPVSRRTWAIAGGVVAVLLALAGRYGYHRDELYFLACGRHLAWGYVDQPPFTPAVARLSEALFGGSLYGLRLFPALADAGIVVLAAATARALAGRSAPDERGRGQRAELLAALGAAFGSVFLGTGHLLATATFDNLSWAAVVYVAVLALRPGADQRLWLLAGAIAGVGLLNKHSVAFLLVGIFAGLVATRRDVLRTPWPWLGALVAVVIWSPNLVWQAQHDWPVLDMSRSLHDEGVRDSNAVLFLPAQLVFLNPVLAPLWVAGLVWLLRDAAARAFRPVAIAWVALAAVFVATSGKPYYLAGLYPALLAGGGVWIERRWSTRAVRRYVTAVVVFGTLSAVVALPILPISAVGDGPIAEVNEEHRESYAWRDFARAVDGAARAGDVVFTGNYGEAGAVERFTERDLRVYSGHNNYWWWGPPPGDATGVVVVGRDRAFVAEHFTGCRPPSVFRNPEDVPNEENGVDITRCAGPRRPWSVEWDALRHYDA